MKLLTLKHAAYLDYKNTVRGNKDITYYEAQKKLTRNMKLAYKFPPLEGQPEKGLYQYGNLQFLVVNGKVVKLTNKNNPVPGWKRSKVKYLYWSKKLGIEDSHTFKQLINKDKSYKQYYAAKEAIR
jgi:hypothetical protein